jgi:hypothetical protein
LSKKKSSVLAGREEWLEEVRDGLREGSRNKVNEHWTENENSKKRTLNGAFIPINE